MVVFDKRHVDRHNDGSNTRAKQAYLSCQQQWFQIIFDDFYLILGCLESTITLSDSLLSNIAEWGSPAQAIPLH